MQSSFFDLHVAVSGCMTAQANLQTVSHNVANASNESYSKQYVMQQAARPMPTNNGSGMVGGGSITYGVGQLRNFFLDQKYWLQSGVLGEYSTKSTQLTLMEINLNELSGTGILSSLDNFFDTVQDLTTTTGDNIYRTNVLQSANQLSTFINSAARALQQQQSDINVEVSAVVDIVNSLGNQIASLNEAIANYEITGDRANDLRDQRVALVDELSQYVNVDVSEVEYNEDVAAGLPGVSQERFYVQINGYDFVRHGSVNSLECIARPTGDEVNPMDASGLFDISFSSTGQVFDIYSPSLSGELKGLLDIRDGNGGNDLGFTRPDPDPDPDNEVYNIPLSTTSYKGIPHYMNKLTELVQTLAKAINQGVDSSGNAIPGVTGHESGYDSDGNSGLNSFFTFQYGPTLMTEADYSNLNCLNFCVNEALLINPDLVACYSSPTLGESENTVILSFANIKDYDGLFSQGSISDYVTTISSELGVDKKQADNFQTSYTDIVTSVHNQRLTVSGVSLNEEMMDMVKYQQLYTSAAKLVNTIDSIYNTLINVIGA